MEDKNIFGVEKFNDDEMFTEETVDELTDGKGEEEE